ncbi:hypothetical protein BLTE_17510 [Blastochloris tepida]|uniref:Uncharacterized protein n=1 Tax=Blastochloris tepida TaxID=2233851 RepID=A0A348G0I3_9HYPH|nr:hypothetical protein BLTE_17510 [Blastochloris tepida]
MPVVSLAVRSAPITPGAPPGGAGWGTGGVGLGAGAFGVVKRNMASTDASPQIRRRRVEAGAPGPTRCARRCGDYGKRMVNANGGDSRPSAPLADFREIFDFG